MSTEDYIKKELKNIAPFLEEARRISKALEPYQQQLDQIRREKDVTEPITSQIEKATSQIQQKYNLLSDKVANLLRDWELSTNRILPFVQQADKAAIALQDKFQKVGLQAAEGFHKLFRIIPPELYGIIQKVIEHPEILFEETNQHALFCYEFGWPPLMHIPIINNKVEKILENNTREEAQNLINEEILKEHDENMIKEILKNWWKYDFLKERIPIVESATRAHINRDYWLSVPTILPQLEGILFVAEKRGTRNEIIEKLLIDDDYVKNNGIVKTYLINRVYTNFDRGKPLPFDLSRHAILHGYDTSYGNAIISLKAILLFDYLVDVIKDILPNK